jgi:cytochrome c553
VSQPGQGKRRAKYLRTTVGQTRLCKSCRKTQPASEFFDGKRRRALKTCQTCLGRKRAATPSRKSAYLAYLASPAWRAKKAEWWAAYPDATCYVCGRERHAGIEMHHRTYTRLGAEALDDLVPVCRGCHQKITTFYKTQRKPKLSLWAATDHVRNLHRGTA